MCCLYIFIYNLALAYKPIIVESVWTCVKLFKSRITIIPFGKFRNIGIRYTKLFLCKTFFITNICQLKESGEKKYLSHNDLFTTCFSQRVSHNVFLTTSFYQRRYHNACLSHNVFLTAYFSQSLPVHIRPHHIILTTSRYTRYLSVLYTFPKYRGIAITLSQIGWLGA